MSSRKRALIVGVTGQDGYYLSRLLLSKGYDVVGTSRRKIGFLKIQTDVPGSNQTLPMPVLRVDPGEREDVEKCFNQTEPDEIYYLAGPSSVGESFIASRNAHDEIVAGTLNCLLALRSSVPAARFFNASSSECFGENGNLVNDEASAFCPVSPYARAKCEAFESVKYYREHFGLHASSGILFNHESPRRPIRFFSQKVISTAWEISKGKKDRLELGRIDIQRDWGWAPEFVEGIWQIVQLPSADDFVLATGVSYKLQDFVEAAFEYFNLAWRDYVVQNSTYFRPLEVQGSRGKIEKARHAFNWNPRNKMPEVVRNLAEAKKHSHP